MRDSKIGDLSKALSVTAYDDDEAMLDRAMRVLIPVSGQNKTKTHMQPYVPIYVDIADPMQLSALLRVAQQLAYRNKRHCAISSHIEACRCSTGLLSTSAPTSELIT